MNTEQIRRFVQDDKMIFGVRETRRLIKDAAAASIIVASNAPSSDAAVVRKEAALAGIEVIDLNSTNKQLGVVCRQPFSISFCAVKK